MPARVLIYEDNNDLREGLSYVIKGTNGFELCGAFGDCLDVVTHLHVLCPDVILMDIEMPGMNGIEGVKQIRKINHDVKIIMLTIFDDQEHVFNALCAGASGYLLKKSSPSKMVDSINEVMDGGAPMSPHIATMVLQLFSQYRAPQNDYNLSDREKQILASLSTGNSFKLIAAELGISLETVRTHIKRIYEKLQVHSQTEAVSKALKENLV